MPNISTGHKKKAQKHQNQFAWQPSKHSPAAIKLASTPTRGLCKKCADVIEWRKRFGKYTPLTVPKKCVSCEQKAVRDAYHILCRKCACEQDVCAKCRSKEEILESTAPKTPVEVLQEQQDEERRLDSMNERQRRSYLRKMEKGDEEGAAKILEKAAAMKAARGGDDDWDDDEDDNFDLDDGDDIGEEEEEEEE
ncbi:hypothetical protein HK101_000582 [Irineochytrium annulatum]|nr:hypothetical protein HK101_000582 [Irineochytrium annulatum]